MLLAPPGSAQPGGSEMANPGFPLAMQLNAWPRHVQIPFAAVLSMGIIAS